MGRSSQKWYGLSLLQGFSAGSEGLLLIHNPTGDGGYVVTNTKNLTKQQKEFLYGYFTDTGDRFKAEMFLED